MMIIHMQEKPGLPALSFSLLATTIPERCIHPYTRVGSFAFTCAICIIQLVEIIIIILQPNGKTSNCGWERDRLASARLWGSLWPLGQRHYRQVCCIHHFWHLHHRCTITITIIIVTYHQHRYQGQKVSATKTTGPSRWIQDKNDPACAQSFL